MRAHQSRQNGKVAAVTRVSQGRGASMAEHLATVGASAVVNYANGRSGADAVLASIAERGGKAIAVQAHVSRVRDIQRRIETKQPFAKTRYRCRECRVLRVRATGNHHIEKHMKLNLVVLTFTTQAAARRRPYQTILDRLCGSMPALQASVYSETKAASRILIPYAGAWFTQHPTQFSRSRDG